MPRFIMSVTACTGNQSPPGATSYRGALLVQEGECLVTGKAVGSGEGISLKQGDQINVVPGKTARWIRFDLAFEKDIATHPNIPTLSETITISDTEFLLRLDEVRFPPGAIAYRHIHPGAGIRYLTAGELDIISDNHHELAKPGHAWFEPAHSPVRAVASNDEPTTRFVRFMALPVKYSGKPTIQILDPEDLSKPRKQVTHRYFDQIVQSEPG